MNAMLQHIQLFEYSNFHPYGKKKAIEELELGLQTLWKQRRQSPFYKSTFDTTLEATEQQLISIDRHHRIKAKNYVGTIQQGDTTLHLLPKIFYQSTKIYQEQELQHIYQHFLWWLSYGSQPKIPLFLAKSTQVEGHMLEIITYLFATYTLSTLQTSTFQMYTKVRKTIPNIRGQLQTTQYFQKQLVNGQWAKLPCQYEVLQKDNLFNQIIKQVATTLLQQTKKVRTKKVLQQILNQLVDVQDRVCSIWDCDKIQLNLVYQDWEVILNYCRLFLSQSTYLPMQGRWQLIAFLLPMEQIFETFIFGFLQQHFSSYRLIYQEQTTYLATNEKAQPQFQLRPDICLYKPNGELLLIDCKYKKIEQQHGQIKGIQIQDFYQIAAYAMRKACKEVYLLYPNHVDCQELIKTYFDIQEEFSKQNIRIWICQIPFMSLEEQNFQNLDQKLIAVFQSLFGK